MKEANFVPPHDIYAIDWIASSGDSSQFALASFNVPDAGHRGEQIFQNYVHQILIASKVSVVDFKNGAFQGAGLRTLELGSLPATRLAWSPAAIQGRQLLAASGNGLFLWHRPVASSI